MSEPAGQSSAASVLVFAGSMRKESLHRKLAQAAALALEKTGVTPIPVELKDYPMPLYDGDLERSEGSPESTLALRRLIREADGLAIASPEYNGSFSPLVKNVIDWVTRPEPGGHHSSAFRGKVAGILSASPGPGGGRRGLQHLRELLQMIGVTVVPEQVVVTRAAEAFDAEGNLVRTPDGQELDKWAQSLAAAIRERKQSAA